MDGLIVGRHDGASSAVRSKALRVLVALMMALALMPAMAVEQAFAEGPTFVGSVYYPVAYDENGYPLYNEDGTFQRGNPYVTLKNVENASGTLVIPASFDVVERADDGTEKVSKNVTPATLRLGGTVGITESGLRPTWENSAITSIDVTQCPTVQRVSFEKMDAITSIKLDGLSQLIDIAYDDCDALTAVSMENCSSIIDYRLDGCASLSLPDFSRPQWSTLTTLQLSNRKDLNSFDGVNCPQLTRLSIYDTALASIDVSSCTALENLYVSNNELTKLDVASIPASVIYLGCQGNRLTDTAALIERFGEHSVLPQSDDIHVSSAGLHVINERVARGTIIPSENYSFSCYGTYEPARDEASNYWAETYDARNAASNFSVRSSDQTVATAEVDAEANQVRVNALKAGTTTLTVDYAFAGEHGTYVGQQVIDFTVVASANPIMSVTCASSVEVPFVSQCAICGEAHESVDGGIMVPIELTAQDSSRLPSASAHVEVASADTGIIFGDFQIEPCGTDSEYAIRLNPHGLGSTTVTLTGVTSVNGQEVRTDPVTVQVKVVEVQKPTLNVLESFTTSHLTEYSEQGGMSHWVNVVSPSNAIASYVEDETLAQFTSRHGNMFVHGYPTGYETSPYPAVWTATSDNEAVVSVVSDPNQGTTLRMNAYGTARVTVHDVWGNEGVCTIEVKDLTHEASKLSLSKEEITVKVGEDTNLASLVQGMDKLDPLYPSRLVFKTGNGYLASVKFADDETYNLSQLRGQHVGDVTVTAGILVGSDMGGVIEDLDQWVTSDFGTLTVHVVPADTPAGNPATAVEVTGASDTVEMGSSLQLSAAITPVDATDADTLAWSSSDGAVASVDASGKVTPVAPGTATITAAVGAVSGTFEVTVVEREVPATGVTISTAVDAMEVGDTQQLTAAVAPADSTDAVEWFSADEGVLTVDQSGLVTAVGNGTTAIGVRAGSAEDETRAITVTTPVSGVSLDKQALELYAGADASKLVATVAPATASNQEVSWASSDSAVATVDDRGNVAPVAPGTATITATTRDGGLTAACEVTVKQHAEGVVLDAHELALTGVQTAPLKATVSPDNATNKGVTWASSDEGVAMVDADGMVTATGKGTATITATTEDGAFSDACVVTVSNPATKLALDPATLALVKGESAQVAAELTGELAGEVDDIGAIAWSSSNESAATVADGAVTAVASGAATITAEATVGGAKLAGTCTVTVTNPVQSVVISETSKTATVGDVDFSLTATVSPSDADDLKVTWASSNAKVATVDTDGTVTVHSVGTANIVASTSGKSAACALTVKAKEMAQTPQGSGFSASVTASDAETVKALEQLAGDGGLNLVVDSIAQLTAPAKAAVEKLTADGAVVADSFDIHFAADDGQEIVLAKDDEGRVALTVRVKLTDSMRALLDQGMKLQVHYVGDDGTVEDKQTWVEDGYLCFTTEHFSDYVVTGIPQKEEGGQPVAPPSDDGQQPLAPTDGGEKLAPTGDPLAGGIAIATVCAVLSSLVCVAAKRSSRRR